MFQDLDTERPLRVAFYIRGYSHAEGGLERITEHAAIWRKQYDRCVAVARELGLEIPRSESLGDDEDAEYIDHTPARLEQQDALHSLLQRLITKHATSMLF